ncbi:hypothetical protein [Brevundimonas sp.]|uniref:hypothetical protein n=1 Tax=Brevundimonas sp. TaxID=1871086 RepID=UPI00289BBC30|nr:hypothetical protein [Brevundimonas sp.]
MAKKHIRGWLLASSVLAGMTAVAVSAPATAQEAEQASQVADIVVTGSRIRQRNLVTTLSGDPGVGRRYRRAGRDPR